LAFLRGEMASFSISEKVEKEAPDLIICI
jgi:hypothetical protein